MKASSGYNLLFGDWLLLSDLQLSWEGGQEGLEQRLLDIHMNFREEARQNKWKKRKSFNASLKILDSTLRNA